MSDIEITPEMLDRAAVLGIAPEDIPAVIARNAAEIKSQWAEALRWAGLLWQANYPTELHGTDEAEPFNQEWRVFGPGWNGPQVATIDIDGCGASWHGPDDLWLRVIGRHTDMID